MPLVNLLLKILRDEINTTQKTSEVLLPNHLHYLNNPWIGVQSKQTVVVTLQTLTTTGTAQYYFARFSFCFYLIPKAFKNALWFGFRPRNSLI